jgi:hypothetical protein
VGFRQVWLRWQQRHHDRAVVAELATGKPQVMVLGTPQELAQVQLAAERAAARSRGLKRDQALRVAAAARREQQAHQAWERGQEQQQAQREAQARQPKAARLPILQVGTVNHDGNRVVLEGWVFGRHGDPAVERIEDGIPVAQTGIGWTGPELEAIANNIAELAPGPDACRCGTPACRSGWQWRPTADPASAVRDGPTPKPPAPRDRSERETEARS